MNHNISTSIKCRNFPWGQIQLTSASNVKTGIFLYLTGMSLSCRVVVISPVSQRATLACRCEIDTT